MGGTLLYMSELVTRAFRDKIPSFTRLSPLHIDIGG